MQRSDPESYHVRHAEDRARGHVRPITVAPVGVHRIPAESYLRTSSYRFLKRRASIARQYSIGCHWMWGDEKDRFVRLGGPHSCFWTVGAVRTLGKRVRDASAMELFCIWNRLLGRHIGGRQLHRGRNGERVCVSVLQDELDAALELSGWRRDSLRCDLRRRDLHSCRELGRGSVRLREDELDAALELQPWRVRSLGRHLVERSIHRGGKLELPPPGALHRKRHPDLGSFPHLSREVRRHIR